MGNNEIPDLLPGTLDLLILRSLRSGEMHGYGIAQRIKASTVRDKTFGELGLIIQHQRDSHDLLS